MAADWKERLLNSGIVPKEQKILLEKATREAEAQLILDAEARTQAIRAVENEKSRRLATLHKTLDAKEFRPECKKLLLLDHSVERIEEVLRIAHANGIHRSKKGGSALIVQLYALKEKMSAPGLSDEDRRRLVEKIIDKR